MIETMTDEHVTSIDVTLVPGFIETVILDKPIAESISETTKPPKKRRTRKETMPAVVDDGHCPACKQGQDLAKGEGTHVLNTVEHPITPPATPEKAVKVRIAPMPKAFKSASYFAEKQLPKLMKDKVRAELEVVRLEKEIQECVRVIQALGGQMPLGMPAAPQSHYAQQPVSMAAIMSDQPLYPQTPNIATLPPLSRAAGGAMGVDLAPVADVDDDAFLTERSQLTGGSGWV